MTVQSDQGQNSFNAVAVGVMALHDRAFFAYLLESPRQAIEAKANELHLQVNEAETQFVEKLINDRKASNTSALKSWDRWKETGLWDLGDWATLWVPLNLPHP
jgi:hypothetical protein